jgi:signal transduction histidine kinase
MELRARDPIIKRGLYKCTKVFPFGDHRWALILGMLFTMFTLPAKPAVAEDVQPLPRFSTIRARVLAVVLLTMLPAFILIIFNTIDERERAVEFTRQGALSTARLVAAEQSQLLANTRQLMQVIASNAALVDGDQATCESFLNRIYETTQGYRGFSIAKPNGDVYCVAPSTPLTQTLNTAHRSYFKKVLATKDFVIGDLQVGAVTGTPNISFGYPILDKDGQLKGVVWAAWSIERLNELAAKWQLPPETSVVLMDSQGTVVTRFPEWQDWVGKRFADSELFKHMRANLQRTSRVPGLDGITRWFAFTTVAADPGNVGASPGSGASVFYLAAGYSDSVLMQDVNGRLFLSLAALGLLSLIGLTIAYGMTDWMIGRRARAMMETARELQRGNWTARTNMTRHDGELGELGRTLDEMADALQQRDRTLQTINAELEERVAVRTSELAAANSQLRASQDDLRRLSQDLLDLTEQERAQVAEDLSEHLGQGLTGIKMDLTLAQRFMAAERDGDAFEHLRAAMRSLDSVVQAAREMAGDLRPSVLDDFGLVAAVEGHLAEFQRQTGIPVHLDAVVEEGRLTKPAGTAAFRVLQAALTNVAQHAHATEVGVSMRTEANVLFVVVQDNGRGFQPGDLLKTQAMGVLGMRERAVQLGGALSVTAVPGKGTTLTLTLPIISAGQRQEAGVN